MMKIDQGIVFFIHVAPNIRNIDNYVDFAYYRNCTMENVCSEKKNILVLICNTACPPTKMYVDTISLLEAVTFPLVIDTD